MSCFFKNIIYKDLDIQVDFNMNDNDFYLVLRELPSINNDTYWAVSFFHFFDGKCQICNSEGYEINNKMQNKFLPCLELEKSQEKIILELEEYIKLSFLLKFGYEFKKVIESLEKRKEMFKKK